MNLTLEKLQTLWEHREEVFGSKKELSERFNKINEIVNTFLKLDTSKYSSRIKAFTSLKEGILEGSSKGCYYNMLQKATDEDEKKHIKSCWELIAGYHKEYAHDDFRIISNNATKPDYHGSLSSSGNMSVRLNGNFASNNYFFNIAEFLQKAKSTNNQNYNDLICNSKIVLTWHGVKDLGGNVSKEDAFNKSKELLNKKFPPKFLWMWANKETVLHPFSLSTFQNFFDTEYGKKILKSSGLTPETLTNAEFDDFTNVWKDISQKITEDILGENTELSKETNKELSKFISVISIEYADLKNIEEILQIGNKAVILWGPPGTGKTYESMQVVKKLLAPYVDSKEFE